MKERDVLLSKDVQNSSERVFVFNHGIIQELKKIVSEFSPDIIQVNGGSTIKYGAALRFLNGKRGALVYRNIGDPAQWVRGWRKKFLYRKLISPQISGIVAVSAATLESVKSVYRFKGPTAVIPRAVDPSTFVPTISRQALRQKLQTPDQAPVLIYVGSITPEKRLDRLLSITARILKQIPQTHLWIVGEGPLKAELQKISSSLRISEQIRFCGSQEDVASHIGAADVLVLTSDTEGIPGVVLEAALLKVPAIATKVGGVAECIQDGRTGILVAPTEEEVFANHAILILQNSELRSELGNEAQQWVLGRFTIDKIASRYCDFYSQLLERKKEVFS